MKVREEYVSTTMFRTHYGHYEFLVMPFGLTNMSAVFKDIMNRVCSPFLVKFIIVFINDMLIYPKDEEKHEQYLREVLEVLRKERLYAVSRTCRDTGGSECGSFQDIYDGELGTAKEPNEDSKFLGFRRVLP